MGNLKAIKYALFKCNKCGELTAVNVKTLEDMLRVSSDYETSVYCPWCGGCNYVTKEQVDDTEKKVVILEDK